MYGNMQESGIMEMHSLICTSVIRGQHPASLQPEPPQGAQLGWLWGLLASRLQCPLFTDMAGTFTAPAKSIPLLKAFRCKKSYFDKKLLIMDPDMNISKSLLSGYFSSF